MKLYPVPLVGESKFQTEIRNSYVGERVLICHETDNPFDDLALRVENSDGAIIGYIARSSWLRRAVHEQGRGTAASIKSIDGGEGHFLGVVIDVTLTDDDTPLRQFCKDAIENSPSERKVEETSTALTVAQINEMRRLLTLLLDSSNVPMTCQCGRQMSVKLTSINVGTKITCVVCGHGDRLSERDVLRLDREFVRAARALLADANLPVPTDIEIVEIAHLHAHRGHKPTTTERGFMRRLLRSTKR